LKWIGTCYRAHDPRWASSPTSGGGAALQGGRFNRTGQPALYLSTNFVCAVLEYCQGVLERLQPVLACRYSVNVDSIADLSSSEARSTLGVELEQLACPWALIAAHGNSPPSWTLADRLQRDGYAGILVPSFVSHAPRDSLNLILWKWGAHPPQQVCVIDDDGRLPRDRRSWTDDPET
jgi:RES domain-containing protein